MALAPHLLQKLANTPIPFDPGKPPGGRGEIQLWPEASQDARHD
jgi:hypothetical protein